MVEYRKVIGINIFEKFCFSIRLILLDVKTYVESIGLDTINGEDRVYPGKRKTRNWFPRVIVMCFSSLLF